MQGDHSSCMLGGLILLMRGLQHGRHTNPWCCDRTDTDEADAQRHEHADGRDAHDADRTEVIQEDATDEHARDGSEALGGGG